MRRERIKMTKIDDIAARQVTFSKRRKGLFKKAHELSVLCDAEITAFVVSPAGRRHQYSSSNIKDILNKFSLRLDSQQHLGANSNYAALSTEVQNKIHYLKHIRGENLQHCRGEELQQLEMKLEAILKHVTAKKRELLMNAASALQTKDSQTTETIRTQSGKTSYSAQENLGTITQINLEGACFPYSQITNNTAQFGAPERWIPPTPDVYKVNFAGAHFQDVNASGVGVVVRNWGGEFMAALARFFPELTDVNAISMMAAKSAIEFSVDYNFADIVLEGDSQDTIERLKNAHEYHSPASAGIMQEALCYMKQLGGCFFSHVQKSGNVASHMVAQYARNVGDELVWLMKEPDFLGDILLADLAQLNY